MSRLRNLMTTALIICVGVTTMAFIPAGEMSTDIGPGDLTVWTEANLLYIPFNPAVLDCGNCSQGGCWSGMHKFEPDDEGPDRAYEEGSHGCKSEFCSVAHPESSQCGPPELAAAWNAARTNSAVSIQTTQQQTMVFNKARHAMQVLGCNGDIMISVPLALITL